MTIATQIAALQQDKSDIATAITNKGGTVNSGDGFDDFATDIATIPTGSTPTLITKNITQNGTYNASSDNADGYSSVTVSVSGGGVGITREVSAQGVYQMPSTNFTFSLPSNATDVGSYALNYAFSGCTALTSVDLSSLTTVSGTNALNYAFSGCTALTSVDLSGLTTITGSRALNYAFQNCTALTSVDLSGLTTITGSYALNYAFSGCTTLISVDLSSLTTVSGTNAFYYAFQNCTTLISVDLSSLTTVSGTYVLNSTFSGCTALTSVDLSSLKTIGENSSSTNYAHFYNAFNNCNNLISISFPKLTAIYCTGTASVAYGTFGNNNKVQKIYFPKLDTITYGSGASSTNQNACKYIFYNCSSLTEIHFGAANQAAIEATAGYSTLWGRGAGNATVYFDL